MIFNKKDFPRPRRVLAVLGMHRSGTSCLTGSLQDAGLFLGKHQTQNKNNLKGNRENKDVVTLHKDLLHANQGEWDQPPATNTWPKRSIKRAKKILAEYSDADLWGFKDPRALFFIEGWKTLIPDIQYIGIFRHPIAVANSLYKRNEFPQEDAFNLWHAHNAILLELHQQNPFPIISFDSDEEELHRNIIAAQNHIGLQAPPQSQERFFSANLRSDNDLDETPLPEKIAAMYQQLQDIRFTA